VISAILRVLFPTPKGELPPELLTNAEGQTSTFSTVTYTGPNKTFPETLSSYRVTSRLEYENQVLTVLKNAFQLKEDRSKSFIQHLGPEYGMVEQELPNGKLFSFSSITPVDDDGVYISDTEALPIANEFVSQYLTELPLTPIMSQIQVITQFEDYAPQSSGSGLGVRIPYTYTIENYPVFYKTSNLFPFEVLIKKTRKVEKLTFHPQFLSIGEKAQEYSVLSIPQAVENIKSGIGTVIQANSEDFGYMDINTIKNATLTDVELEYRVDEERQVALPFFRFQATMINENNMNLLGEVLTPAIPVTAVAQ
jgi:hypothetical protein